MTAGNAALMSPDERLPAKELVDIKLQRLRDSDIGGVEPDVIYEVMNAGNNGVIPVGQTLR